MVSLADVDGPPMVPANGDLNGDSNGITIPKTCKAGVVEEFGPNFKLVVKQVPVPEPGTSVVVKGVCNSMCADLSF